MTFQEAIKSVYTNYANFAGRAVRSEYWYWMLFYFIVVVVLQILAAVMGSRESPSILVASIFAIWSLGSLIPALAVTVRRLHDTDRSGWFILLALIPLVGAIILIIWYCNAGTPGPNRFGPPPVAALPGMASAG